MYLRPAFLRSRSSWTLAFVILVGIGPELSKTASSTAEDAKDSLPHLAFIREFSSADDVTRQEHPVFDRSLDIIAGPAEPRATPGNLVAPNDVATDSRHRVFVADEGAGIVHVFDTELSKYSVLGGGGDHLRSPSTIAVDREDNVYVTDAILKAVSVYDSKGKFLRYLGKGEGSETYFEAPVGIAIHAPTNHIYVCDSRRHMIIMLDKKGRILGHFGKRWGGKTPGDFRFPSKIVIVGDEIFVLDPGNFRLQVLDLGGHFRQRDKASGSQR